MPGATTFAAPSSPLTFPLVNERRQVGRYCRETSMPSQDELWSKVAQTRQQTHANSSLPVYKKALEMMALSPAARILDTGCGSGEGVRFFTEQGLNASGSDPAAGMIELARKQVSGADFQIASTEKLPFASDHFDGATAVN